MHHQSGTQLWQCDMLIMWTASRVQNQHRGELFPPRTTSEQQVIKLEQREAGVPLEAAVIQMQLQH